MPVTIETREWMEGRWGRPSGIILKEKTKAYVTILEAIEVYEATLNDGTLTLDTQESLLNEIYQACGTWITEDKGKSKEQYNYFTTLRSNVDKLLDNQYNIRRRWNVRLSQWYKHPWAWKKIVAAARAQSCLETFQFYEAVQKWASEVGSRQGALYIMNVFFVVNGNPPNVIVEPSVVDPATILGRPDTSINISSETLISMLGDDGTNTRDGLPVVGTIRRADITAFNPAIRAVESLIANNAAALFGREPILKALTAHVSADVSGLFPIETHDEYLCIL